MAKSICEYIDPRSNTQCHKNTRYWLKLRIHKEDIKRWVGLCGTCDRREGRRNLIDLGWSLDDTIKWEKDPDYNPIIIARTFNPGTRNIGFLGPILG